MITKLATVFFLFSSILGSDIFPITILHDAPGKEVTQEITKVFRDNSKTVSETSRNASGYNDIPQKNTCPPIDNSAHNELDYKECDEIKNLADITPHPDQNKTTPEILETYGYSCKEHRVRTEDGYILAVFRITGSPKIQRKEAHMTPVYINHGLLGSSDLWLCVSPEKSLPLMMADEGYDVWIANARGNTYSFRHETLNYKKNLSYWEFSFHEMAIYDVPAVTETILKEANRKSLIYVGLSMGTTQILIALSELPEMNNKFGPQFSLPPHFTVFFALTALQNYLKLRDDDDHKTFPSQNQPKTKRNIFLSIFQAQISTHLTQMIILTA